MVFNRRKRRDIRRLLTVSSCSNRNDDIARKYSVMRKERSRVCMCRLEQLDTAFVNVCLCCYATVLYRFFGCRLISRVCVLFNGGRFRPIFLLGCFAKHYGTHVLPRFVSVTFCSYALFPLDFATTAPRAALRAKRTRPSCWSNA